MKIEKLTDNKIRVIVNSDELGLNHINVHSIMTKAIETQDIFLDILKKAEKEVDFYTDGCKLLIEAFSSFDDIIVFTITKFSSDNDNMNPKKKKLIVKRKSFDTLDGKVICRFENFDSFCAFCNAVYKNHKMDCERFTKNTALYLWKEAYYLVLKNIDSKYLNVSLLHSILSEFGKLISFSDNFESKLIEHGKSIIKKNAIDVGIKYF